MENGNGHWTLDSQLATARLKNAWLLLLTHSVPPKAELPSAEVLLRSLEFQSRKTGSRPSSSATGSFTRCFAELSRH